MIIPISTLLVGYKVKVPKKISEFFRSIDFEGGNSIGLFRFDEDVILTDKRVKAHTDNTKPGFNSIITVLVNDRDYKFKWGSEVFDFEEGTVIRFDGNVKHSLITDVKSKHGHNRFAAIVWDVPVEKETVVLVEEIKSRLKEF